MKKLSNTLSVISCALLSFNMGMASAATSQANLNKEVTAISQQLNIMNDIISSALSNKIEAKGNRQASNNKVSGVNSLYLYGQGVVFTVSSNSYANRWGDYHFNFKIPSLPPVPPLAPKEVATLSDEEMERNIEETVERAMEVAESNFERAFDASQESLEQYRELREAQRDIEYEMRDIERATRDVEYQARRADAEAKEKLDKKMAKLKKEKAAYKKEREALKQKVEKAKKEQKNRVVKQEKQRIAYYQGLTKLLTETICTYGNGLRALSKDEHVSLILKSGGNKVGRGYQDQIYVFKKSDINACSIDKMDAKTLLTKARTYQF